MRVVERPFSELLRDPKKIIRELADSDVVLRRRGTSALRLSRADRAEERAAAFEALARRITSDPRLRDQRQHPLKGSLIQRSVNGKNLDQWQYEATGAGRIWYCINDDARTIWMTDASVGHPMATESASSLSDASPSIG